MSTDGSTDEEGYKITFQAIEHGNSGDIEGGSNSAVSTSKDGGTSTRTSATMWKRIKYKHARITVGGSAEHGENFTVAVGPEF